MTRSIPDNETLPNNEKIPNNDHITNRISKWTNNDKIVEIKTIINKIKKNETMTTT